MDQRLAHVEALVRFAPYLQPSDMVAFGLTAKDFPHHLTTIGSSLPQAEMVQMTRQKKQVHVAKDLELVSKFSPNAEPNSKVEKHTQDEMVDAERASKKQRKEKPVEIRGVERASGAKKLTKPISSHKKQKIPSIIISPVAPTPTKTTTTTTPVSLESIYVPPPVFSEPLTPITAAILASWPKPKAVKPTASEKTFQRAEMTIKERMAKEPKTSVITEATIETTTTTTPSTTPPSTPRKAPSAPSTTTPPRDLSTPRLMVENKFRYLLLQAHQHRVQCQVRQVQPRHVSVHPSHGAPVLDRATRLAIIRDRIVSQARHRLPPQPARDIEERRAKLINERRKVPHFQPLTRSQVLEEQEIGGRLDRMLLEIKEFLQSIEPKAPIDDSESFELRVEDLEP